MLTLKRGYPYPDSGVAPDVPLRIMNLAEALDADVDAIVGRVTALETVAAGSVPLDVSLYAAYGAGYSSPSYVKTPGGLVVLAGRVGVKTGLAGDQVIFSPATLYTVGTLPAGMRPALAESWDPDVSFNMRVQAYWQAIVQPDGRIQIQHSSASAVTVSRVNFTLALSGMTFKAA